MSAVIPSPSEVWAGVHDTRMLLRLRWRFVREARSKVFITLGGLAFMAILFATSQLGTLVRRTAERGTETAAGQFAVNYVISLTRGELGLIGASAIGSVFIVALFAPFTGSAMSSLAPAEDLSGIRPSRLHRYFDSLVTTGVSAIGILQLITLTGLASLLTLDGGRAGGLLFLWAMWPAVILLSVFGGWGVEYVHRRFGATVRRGTAAVLAAAVGLAVYLDADHGQTMFGLGTQITATLRAAAEGRSQGVLVGLGVITIAALVLFMGGMVLCRAALALPAAVSHPRTERRRLVPISTRPQVALLQILFAQAIRIPEVRRPLLTIVVIGVPAIWFGTLETVMTTMVVAVPLAVALSFGINLFGLLGPAMPWLASQPRLMRSLFINAAILQIGLTLTIAALLWVPPAFAGRLDPGDIAALAAGTLTATFLTSRSAAAKSVHRPFLVRLGSRGDMIVPPLTAINYTFRFVLWSGQLGVLVMTRDGWLQGALVALAIAWSLVRFIQLYRLWSDREVQAYVIKEVSAA